MQRKDIILIGAGGFGREVLWQISESKHCKKMYNVKGFVDDASEFQGKTVNGFPVLGNIQWLKDYPKEICAVFCIGNSVTRKAVYDMISCNRHISFPTVIADDVQHSDSVTFGQGCIVCLSNVLTVNIKIGDFVIINLDCTIGHDAVLDDFATLYPGVNVSGNAHIGACTEIGTGASIIQGKTIGENSIIGAGAVVISDIPPSCVAVGVPATSKSRNIVVSQ
jgi:sugar O-acyltransferase (sialic acid O-acetyltransferase NeuD family)